MMQIGTAVHIGTFRSAATIRPPLHSRIGSRDTRKITSSAGMTVPRLLANQTASPLVILKNLLLFLTHPAASPRIYERIFGFAKDIRKTFILEALFLKHFGFACGESFAPPGYRSRRLYKASPGEGL
jgi:hypothetical protein